MKSSGTAIALARRIEHGDARGVAESIAALAVLRPDIGATCEPIAGGLAAFGGLTSPLSRTHALGMQGPVSDHDLDRLEAFYRERGLGTHCEICPYADPTMIQALGRRGYRLVGFINLFVREIDNLRDLMAPGKNPAGLQVRRIDPSEGVAWSRLIGQGFGEADPSPATVDIGLSQLGRDHVACFQAEIDGVAIGGGVVACLDGIAYLYAGSTLPQHRERGAQAALIAARLAFGRDAGCTIASVGSTAGSPSQRNIERAGFQVAYTRTSFALEHT